MRRAVRLLLAAVVVGGIVFLFVLPGRTWLSQSHEMSVAQRQQHALSAENRVLGEKVAQLQNPADIEQTARNEYGLVMPGANAYAILPPPGTTTTTVPARSATKAHHHQSFWDSLVP